MNRQYPNGSSMIYCTCLLFLMMLCINHLDYYAQRYSFTSYSFFRSVYMYCSLTHTHTNAVIFPTSHTEWASMMQWARRRGWRPAVCVPGVCSSVPWEQSGRWSWCCWESRCSCRRHSAALCCAAGWLCAPSTNEGTSALITAAQCPAGLRCGGWTRRAELGKRSCHRGPLSNMCRQDGWNRRAAPEWSQEPCGWSWQFASPPGCGQWWTAGRWRRTLRQWKRKNHPI